MTIWTTAFEVLLIVASIVAVGLFSALVFETFRRRFNHDHVEAPPILVDPNSSKQVPCPHIFDSAEKYISLIVPAYNEENRLPEALDETLNYLQQRAAKDKSFTYEVIIVDDGSADGTTRVAFDYVKRYLVENVRVILLGRNHGKGEAIRKGMLHSRGELLLMLDADGATKVTDLEKLENQIHIVARKEHEFGQSVATDATLRISDIPIAAFGSRAHLEERALATRKWYRNFLMKGFHAVVLLAAGSGIRDTQCGFKMFTRAAARKLFTNIHLKRQASFFFKDKIKVARLALLDVSPAQLLTEEATNGDSLIPDTRTMRLISRAAFEVDDYWRIVDILHKRLQKYNRHNWRAAYQAMTLLEHLLTQGPARVAEEFQDDQEIIREMANLNYVDEKGFNLGLSVQRKAGRVLKLIEDGSFLTEERARERKLSLGIKGFGSFCQRPVTDESLRNANSEKYLRCNSHFCDYQTTEDALLASDNETTPKPQDIRHRRRDFTTEKPVQNSNRNRTLEEDDHPFYDEEHQALASLLSSG